MKTKLNNQGFTIAEMAISIIVISIVALSVIGLFTALVKSAVVAKRKAVASTLATNQMEYLRSLPYDSLAVAGGPIYSANPLPASFNQTLDGVTYTVQTSINYVDDAYDGCGSYPTQQLKQTYCRNYPPPAGSPAVDPNPQDYKIVHINVSTLSTTLASVDTEVAARVAETASTTGAMFVSVIDDTGATVSGATVQVINNNVTPAVNLSDTTDVNGIAIFYGLPPDTTGYDYNITGSLNSYSTLTTIKPNGNLQPNYSNQNILNQQSTFVTLTLKPQGTNSIILETTNTAGTALPGVKVYVKGGYKKYTSAADTTYYYDNMSPSDSRPTTDANGLTALSNLVPGSYIFCGDVGATSCSVGGTTYYLVAAIPYSSPDSNSFNPIIVPRYTTSSPPAITYPYNGLVYLQKVRLMLTTDSSFPRINNLVPDTANLSGDVSNFSFQVNGANLPCSSNPASCATSVKFTQGASTYTASCTGTVLTQLSCTVNLNGSSIGSTQMVVSVGAKVLTMPLVPIYGGINVAP